MSASASFDSALNQQAQLVPEQLVRPTLLVVDDEQGPRLSLQVIFNDRYHVLLAEDGPSAIELAKNQRVDVAVLDIRMGGMSGIEVLERLRYIDPDIEADDPTGVAVAGLRLHQQAFRHLHHAQRRGRRDGAALAR